MKDIAPELLEKIKKSFEERMKQNGAIKKLETRLKAGEGGFEEAEEYAGEVGRALSAAFGEQLSSDVLPDGRMYFNIADRVVTPLMEEEYRLATEAGMQAVRVANERAGIHLQGREPAFEPERVKGIVDRLASEESFDAVKWILGDPVESYAVHCVDETVKQNAEFLHKAGRTARIRRDSASRCCDWCAALDGVYEYPGVPRDIYARHNNCTCTVEYLPGDGKAQDVWSKNSRDVSTREERRIFSERAISKEEAEERIRRAEEIKKSLQEKAKGQQNVTLEYVRNAKPGTGSIVYPEGFDYSKTNEIEAAEIIHRLFGGEIVMRNESDVDGVKSADYLWNGKLWDLKNPTTAKAANSAVRSGLKQIAENRGGVILNYGNQKVSLQTIEANVIERMQWYKGDEPVDIMILSGGRMIKTIRFRGK